MNHDEILELQTRGLWPKEESVEFFKESDIEVFGLNETQILYCKNFYESETGLPADCIGRAKQEKDTPEKVLEEMLEWHADQETRKLPKWVERARKLLEGNK